MEGIVVTKKPPPESTVPRVVTAESCTTTTSTTMASSSLNTTTTTTAANHNHNNNTDEDDSLSMGPNQREQQQSTEQLLLSPPNSDEYLKNIFGGTAARRTDSDNLSEQSLWSSSNGGGGGGATIQSPQRKKARFVGGDNSLGDNSQIWMDINPLTLEGNDHPGGGDEFDSTHGDDDDDDVEAENINNNNNNNNNETKQQEPGPSQQPQDNDNNDAANLDRAGSMDEVDDANLFQMLAQAAAAQGISLEWIMEQARHESSDDDDNPNNTTPVEYPFDTLPTDLAGVAEFIQSDKCQRIVILAGAGMSVSSGIPDFRSADGLYATLRANRLTASPAQQEAIREDPAFALDQHLFLENPLPLLETKRDFILGTYEQRWKATLAHRFVELLHSKTGKLVRLYTQNIDGLEDQCTQLPEEKVIPVHGTMDRAECAQCGTRASFSDFCHRVRSQIKDITGKDASAPSISTPITCPNCGSNALKPSIVLFRSSLPKEFFESVGPDVKDVDLLIVIGTSLKVAPANSIVWRVPRSAMRLLVNREVVGEHLGMDFENQKRDFFGSGNCDNVLLDLMDHLGWLPDLEACLADRKLPQSCAELLQERLVKSKGVASGGDADRDGSTENTEATNSSEG